MRLRHLFLVALFTTMGLLADAYAGDLLPKLLETHLDNGITMQIDVQADIDQVREILSQARTAAALSPDVLNISVTPRGRCEQVEVETRGFLSSLNYISLRCPTDDGWTETLISSDDFSFYDVQWSMTPIENGTRVTYRIDIEMKNLPVPERLLHSNLSSSMKHSLIALADRFIES